ncbi:MAG: PilW family protein [Pseudomonadota bacterium]
MPCTHNISFGKGKPASGFSLVELMVALVIGLLIIVGAGQLFLTVMQTNRQVELLSDKQAAITYVTEDLIREVRRGEFDPSDYQLTRIEEGSDAAMLEKDGPGGFQALVGGMMMPSGEAGNTVSLSDLASINGAVATFTFDLEAVDGGREAISFVAVNRTGAVGGGGTGGGDDAGGGNNGGGNDGNG